MRAQEIFFPDKLENELLKRQPKSSTAAYELYLFFRNMDEARTPEPYWSLRTYLFVFATWRTAKTNALK